jgi:RimJ/RimL family protein N-acetyltransferase
LTDFVEDVIFLQQLTLLDNKFYCRFVRESDSKDIFKLVNDKDVRQYSIHPEPIDWDTHQNWFRNKINNPKVFFWILRNTNDKLVAYVRYDYVDNENKWICSVAVSQEFRGKGLGTFVLKKTLKLLRQSRKEPIEAGVHINNIPSIKMFQKAGYKQTNKQIYAKDEYLIFQI